MSTAGATVLGWVGLGLLALTAVGVVVALALGAVIGRADRRHVVSCPYCAARAASARTAPPARE